MSHEAGTRSAPLRFASLVPFLTLETINLELFVLKFRVVNQRAAGALTSTLSTEPFRPLAYALLSVNMQSLFERLQIEGLSILKQVIATRNAPQAIGPYSQAIKASGMVFASGQIPIVPATGEFIAGGVAEQTEQVLRNLSAVLEAAGADLSNVVKTTVFLADMNDFVEMNKVYERFFSSEPPARATVEAARLPRDARVEIDAIALIENE